MHETKHTAAQTRLLKITEVQKRLGLCRASIYNHVKAGRLPAPVRLGKQSRWLEGELEQCINGLAAARATA